MTHAAIIRWGIAGTGAIARQFAADMAHADGARLVAVASRDPAKARKFAAPLPGVTAYGSFDAMAASSEVDALYIASPNTAHLPQALSGIAARKAVLVEKPLTADPADARALASAAAHAGVFAMEAMWSRYLPAVRAARDLIAQGRIGRVTRLEADLGWTVAYDAESRLFDKAQGGGALHDIGVYPISLARFLLGEAELVTAEWFAAPSGVDLSARLTLDHAGVRSVLACGFDRQRDNRMVIEGSAGTLVVGPLFIKASSVQIFPNRAMADRFAPGGAGLWSRIRRKAANLLPLPGVSQKSHPFPGNGLQFEITAASTAIRSGLREEPDCTLADSIKTLDLIKAVLARAPKE